MTFEEYLDRCSYQEFEKQLIVDAYNGFNDTCFAVRIDELERKMQILLPDLSQ